jgi:hypothetical protein
MLRTGGIEGTSVAAAEAMAEAAVSAGVLAALSQAVIVLGQLVANPVVEQEAIPAVALAAVVIAEEKLGCLRAGLAVQARFYHAYESSSSFDEAETSMRLTGSLIG